MSKSQSPLNQDLFNLFFERYSEAMEKMPPVQILVAGKTGVGKSTLVNQVFREPLAETGAGLPVTKRLQKWEVEGLPLVLYDSRGIELDEKIRTQVKAELMDLIRSKKQGDRKEDRIHLVWYCINDLSSRIESYEIDLIRELSEELPVVLVLTQSIQEPPELKQQLETMDLPVRGTVPVLAKDFPLRGEEVIKSYGLNTLVDLSLDLLPEAVQGAFINAQRVDLSRKVKRAEKAVRGFVSTAFATGFTPIPFSDAAVLVPMQIGMIAQLSSIFGISLQQGVMRSLVTALGGAGGATYLGRSIVAGVFKFFPGIGTVAGGMITGSTAGMLTYALGRAYIRLMVWMTERENEENPVEAKEISKKLRSFWKDEWKKVKGLTGKVFGRKRKKKHPELPPPELFTHVPDDGSIPPIHEEGDEEHDASRH